MSFLFPLYLIGAAALAIPILLHLRRRPPKEHIPFSSHLFLEKTPERVSRRTRLERWLLLALRCLALLLLAFAFSRPFLPSFAENAGAGSTTRAVVLLDESASMRREELWPRALEAAREAIGRYEAGDEVALATFDDSIEWVADFPAWVSLDTRGRLAALKDFEDERERPSWLETDLGLAMTAAADRLLAEDADGGSGRRELIVISDFQDGARREALRAAAWPEEVRVLPVPVEPDEPGNLSLNLAATPLRANVEEEEVYRVRVRNTTESDETLATVAWRGFPDTAIETTVAPGTSRIVTSMPRPAAATEGVLEVVGDSHPFDNTVYVSPVQPRPLRVFFLDESGPEETAGSPLFYLRRALQPTPVLEPRLNFGGELTDAIAEANDVVVVAGAWSGETADRLHTFAEEGGLVLALPSSEADSSALGAIADQPEWSLSEAEIDDYALLADLDFEHPVLAPFARARIRDFTRVRFWKHRNLSLPEPRDAGTRVLATFDGESPALVEHRVGEGALFAVLSGWEPRESQLALSSKFVPLLFSLFEHSGFSIRSAATLHVGESERDSPGFHRETVDGETTITAVNLAPREGNTTGFDPVVVFPDLGIPLVDLRAEDRRAALTDTQLARLASEEKEQRQKVWKWLILGALIVLLVETFLAGRPFGRGRLDTATPAGGAAA